jgi:hypothetical protein
MRAVEPALSPSLGPATRCRLVERAGSRELDRARAQDERFERNWSWFNRHAQEIYAAHRGKCLCIAGEELFVADSPEQALALARTAHPDDGGFFTRIIPRERIARIYALDGGSGRGVSPRAGKIASVQPLTQGRRWRANPGAVPCNAFGVGPRRSSSAG